MILKGSQRSNAAQLARHLMNVRDNDHVELHELRGFVGSGLGEALMEAEAIAKGTRCRQCLFSLSLNPPPGADASIQTFETAIEMAETRLGLEGQPRAVIFHEKEGRRHAHVVWSRIDAMSMTARPLPFFKTRLMEVAKEIYLEQGWDMPKGLIDRNLKNPHNFTRAEWQQAQRMQDDPRLIKAMVRECWSRSDNAAALQSALEDRGYFLARGDRRSAVVIDWRGEVYALARWAGVKTKEVKERLGDVEALRSVEETKALIASRMSEQMKGYVAEVQANYRRLTPSVVFRREQMVQRQRGDRESLAREQAARRDEEMRARAARLPKGLGGLWSRITGKYTRIRRQNEYEALKAEARDRTEKDALIARQLEERRGLQATIQRMREQRAQEIGQLRQEIADYLTLKSRALELPGAEENSPEATPRGRTRRRREKDGPEMEM